MMGEFSKISQTIETISSFFEIAKWVVVGIGIVFAGGIAAVLIIDKRDADRSIRARTRLLPALVDRHYAITKKLSSRFVPLGRERRERLTAEKSLIDSELTHLRSRSESTDSVLDGQLEGVSRAGLLGLRRRREKIFAAVRSGEVRPGPEVSRKLYAIDDEIVAIEERLGNLPREPVSVIESALQTQLNDTRTLHDEASARWGKWHTDLGLLTEFPAIHDVQHEAFARRIIDAQDAAREARSRAEARRDDRGCVERFGEAVEEFVAALDDGEHKARLIARGPALDPVLNRIMTTAETLLAKIHAYRAGDGAVSWGECQTAADGLVKLLKPVVGHQAEVIPELEAAIARELEPSRG
jgi:hypothetical protein